MKFQLQVNFHVYEPANVPSKYRYVVVQSVVIHTWCQFKSTNDALVYWFTALELITNQYPKIVVEWSLTGTALKHQEFSHPLDIHNTCLQSCHQGFSKLFHLKKNATVLGSVLQDVVIYELHVKLAHILPHIQTA